MSSVCLVTAVNGRLRRTVLTDINSASSTPLRRFLRFRRFGILGLCRGFVWRRSFCSASGRDTGNDGSASRFHWDFVYFHSTKRCPQSSQASVGVCDGHRTTEPQCGCDRSPSLSVVMALACCMPILPPSEQAATSSSF